MAIPHPTPTLLPTMQNLSPDGAWTLLASTLSTWQHTIPPEFVALTSNIQVTL